VTEGGARRRVRSRLFLRSRGDGAA